jgi:hypothetical protein
MSGLFLSILFEPLTPLFFGKRQTLSPYEYVGSSILPSIYTVGGAVLRMINEFCGLEFKEMEEKVNDGSIEIKGPYIAAWFNNNVKYYVPAPTGYGEPLEQLPYLGYLRLDKIPVARMTKKFRIVAKDSIRLVEIRFNHEKREWGIDLNSQAILRAKMSDRTSFEMERAKRIVQHGTLYFRSMIESYTLDSDHYGWTSKISFGCDIKIPEEVFNKLLVIKNAVLRFGGEGGLCKANVHSKETPLIKTFRIKEKIERRKTLLATSHIALLKEDNRLYALGFGEIEWILGKVELLGGWLTRSAAFKKHIPTLLPSSLFRVHNPEYPSATSSEWYLKLLTTALPC